ncbi:MAG: carboxylating nicotinate-nucleotide diphosphorylase [Sulfolobaceae archaeon]|nr:carboxylating nicotinate-nucleotide diphosphorylase [Sulfolobales archaeon]
MLDVEFAVQKLWEFLREDAYPEDLTSRIVRGVKAEGVVLAKSEGVLAGLRFVVPFLTRLGFTVQANLNDGERFSKGQEIAVIRGDGELLLGVERTVLNLLMRLSGIASATREMVEKAKGVNPKVRIAGTRKTTPGLRAFEKYAIEVGGGDPHRFGLYDAVLIKDNHIALLGSVREAVMRARKVASFTKIIEVEVSDLKSALEAVEAGAHAILLDNVGPKEAREVIEEVRKVNGRVIVEVSGGITPDNVVDYALAGPDVISSGYLTHSVRAKDMSLEVKPINVC